MTHLQTIQIIITGKVQGVYFRQSSLQKANELGLCGWVKNLPDGNVEIRVSGSHTEIDKLIQWANIGPRLARVKALQINELPYEAFDNFSIVR